MRVLLVEDDPTLGEAVRDHVISVHHAVDWMQTLDGASSSIRVVEYGLVLLDLRLPDGNGISLLRDMRSKGDATPIIILTAHDQISDRIEGLNAGADDYLVKPFNLDELTARILAVTRRHSGNFGAEILVGALRINMADKSIFLDNQEITLSGREWAIFDKLLSRAGAIISKSQIEEALHGFGWDVKSNTVAVYISRLRKKLGRKYLTTIRGVGYKIEGVLEGS